MHDSSYDFWRRRLAGEIIPIHDSEPQAGFYRLKSRDGSLPPVAYWFQSDGMLRCRIDNKEVDEQRAREQWVWASKHPVTHDAYDERIRTGKWPDENSAVIGDNRAPDDDSVAALAERISDLAREAERLIATGEAQSQDACDQASDVANTLGELEAKTTALHKSEKQPCLDAGRAVDAKWFSLRDRAADLKRRLKAVVVTPWLTRRKAEVEAANIAAISAGVAPDALPQQRVTAGASKRQSALRTHHRAEIIDRAALIESLKDHPDLLTCIQTIADAAARKKIALPGCKIIAEQKAA